jgi:preprotein translocase subunit SecE
LRRQVLARGQEKQRFRFIGETISELRKVVWPTRREATYLTTIVIVVTVVIAIILWVIDVGFSEMMNVILFR